jgi:hypothetical protein
LLAHGDGSGCACGTLYTIGGGRSILLFTRFSFAMGSFLGSFSSGVWQQLPRIEPLFLLQLWGWPGVIAHLLVQALLAFWLWRRQRQGLVAWQGSWSLFTGAVVLALLNSLTVVLAGRLRWSGFSGQPPSLTSEAGHRP